MCGVDRPRVERYRVEWCGVELSSVECRVEYTCTEWRRTVTGKLIQCHGEEGAVFQAAGGSMPTGNSMAM